MTTDTSERGLERLICTTLAGHPCDPTPTDATHERPPTYGVGWAAGDPKSYDREYCVDLAQLGAFVRETQTLAAEALDLDTDGPTRRKFLARLQGEISKRGTIDVHHYTVTELAGAWNLSEEFIRDLFRDEVGVIRWFADGREDGGTSR